MPSKKYVVFTITLNEGDTGSRMKYPPIWDPYEVDHYKSGPILLDGGLSRGEDSEEGLFYTTTEVADKYVNDNPALCRIVSEAEANTWIQGNKKFQKMPDEEYHQERLLGALVRQLVGGAPTQDDLDAINPDHPSPGIRKTIKHRTAAEIFVDD